MSSLFADSPEYNARKRTLFLPTTVTLAQVHASIPADLYTKSTVKGLLYVARDVFFAVLAYKLASFIDPFCTLILGEKYKLATLFLSSLLWMLYWSCQGVILAGLWCLGHEAGHGNLSQYRWINNLIGFILHTFLLAPYFSWRATHHAHHKSTNSVERDENYVPRTRADCKLPSSAHARPVDYHAIFEDTPICTLVRLLTMQVLGWQYYLLTNALGSPAYPRGTNHFSPYSPLFKPHERKGVVCSNIGLAGMATLLCLYAHLSGVSNLIKFYLVPYLLVNHWIVMLTFLHHSDPTVPYFRRAQWTFLRGALATVDRPFLGWAGRFFLHNVSHDHIAHHLFSSIPFYNQPKVTEHIKRTLKDDYNYDSTNTFRALYRSFTECCFIEDEGDIVFYKNRHGNAARHLSEEWTASPPVMNY